MKKGDIKEAEIYEYIKKYQYVLDMPIKTKENVLYSLKSGALQ